MRVLGPIDATILDFLFGSARTMTQPRATVVVHRDAGLRDPVDDFGATATRGAALVGGRTTLRAGVVAGSTAGARTEFRTGVGG